MDAAQPAVEGRIGPNAVTRMAQALDAAFGPATTARLFRAAGLEAHLDRPPTSMVPERDVIRLHRALRAELGDAEAAVISREAGRLTAEYLLANRIPRPVQWLLRLLPPWPAARVLLGAIGRHAWTFAGSGSFRVLPGRPLQLEIRGGPIGRAAPAIEPVCDFYTATFETLFQALVSRRSHVVETACEACGDPACLFEVRW